MLTIFLNIFESVLGNFYFLLGIISVSFTCKLFLLIYLVMQAIKSLNNTQRSIPLLIGVLIASMVSNMAWIIKLAGTLFITSPEMLSDFNTFFYGYISPIAWMFPIIEYQSLALFIENLVDDQFQLTARRVCFLLVSLIFLSSFIVLAIAHLSSCNIDMYVEQLKSWCAIYCLFPLMLSSIAFVIWRSYFYHLPKILHTQSSLIIKIFIIPNLFFNIIQVYPFNFSRMSFTLSYAVVGLSALLNTFALYYCSRKIIGLRFLNFNNHVQSPARFNFVNSFKDVLEQFSMATSNIELIHTTQTFFKESFNIPLNRTMLYIRHEALTEGAQRVGEISSVEMIIETFFASNPEMNKRIMAHNVLIHDELEFSYFYEKSADHYQFLKLLQQINADILLPIYKNNSIIAYIIIDRNARTKQFYNDGERDEMLIFAHYIGNMIHLLKSRQLESLIEQEKDLKEELYNKHQEINQYKESIRSFLRTKPKEIGIVFYKNRKFILGNQMAQELIKINLNMQEGHPLTKVFKQIATAVEEYKSPQATIYNDNLEQKLVISGVPNLEKNNVIITIYPPDISDIIKRQIDMLKDPSKWDYLLYLETTKSGQLINQLIPGSGEVLLNFKINLLKLALSKSAILLDMQTQDLLPTVEILHHISLREQLHVLSLKGPSSNNENAIKLFGINPLFGVQQQAKSLLEKLDTNGTLFIENIHFLETEAQEYLAEYLKYGMYRVFKSDQKRTSNVRIICSSNQNLQAKVQDKTFSAALYNELNQATLSMPSLLTLSEDELLNLTDGFSHIALHNQPFVNLLELTDKEKNKINQARPVSLYELKSKVQQLLQTKSKKNQIVHETHFDPAYEITNPDLVQAARLGKQALKDQRIMTMLWDKYKNQNKIAAFLGVNRSSVNRRCKEFNLQ